MRELVGHMEGINRLLARYGVKFGIYKNKEFHEQLFPFFALFLRTAVPAPVP